MNLKRISCILFSVLMAIFLISCGKKEDSTGESIDEMPADLTEYDLKIVEEINSESTLFCTLYDNLGNGEEPYYITTSKSSNAVAVCIPKDNGPLRVKEIEILDPEYNLYGMSVGISQKDFEEEMIKRGYSLYQQIESMGYEAFTNGNIYVALAYNSNSKVERIFINLLLEYNEWRPIE